MAGRNSSSARALMVQGCTSDAGKTHAGRRAVPHPQRRGVHVAPFKPQNMALNSAVTADGGEIGRAQALQAQAAGLPPRIDFNPVLLKPTTDQRAQVIIHGKAVTRPERPRLPRVQTHRDAGGDGIAGSG